MSDRTYSFELPPQNKSIIKVIGVGGGGSNAVNHMYSQGIKDVEFFVCNTDLQALHSSPVPNKIQIGSTLTQGLGAGANPEKGKNAAIESKEDIRDVLSEDTRMLFITAGMGGGTGTGAAPEIAKVAKELGILTVGIVTQPFGFEGRKKIKLAEQGLADLRQNCDTVLVILNDKLREVYSNLTLSNAFAQADNVLTTAAKSIAEIITLPGYINVDFEDVKTVMANSGAAVMGSARAEGDQRSRRAAEMALSSPLLDNVNIRGAQKILLSIKSGTKKEIQMEELDEITSFIHDECGQDAEMIFGHGIDEDLQESVMVTVIATGFKGANEGNFSEEDEVEVKRVIDLESNRRVRLGGTPLGGTPPDGMKQDGAYANQEPPKRTMGPAERATNPHENGNTPEPDADSAVPTPRQESTRPSEFPPRSSSNGERRSDQDQPETTHTGYRWGDPEPRDEASSEEPLDDDDARDVPTFPNDSHYDRSWDLDTTKDDDEAYDHRHPSPNDRSNGDQLPPEPSRYRSNPEPPDSSESEPEEEYLFQRELSPRKKVLMEEAYQRKLKLRGRKSISSPDSSQEQFQKENFSQPAYLRKNVHLYSTPPSNDQNVSRYSLDDESNIVGNNRFLHDNVD
ncbi:MAG: cell division protein FtsZ [Tunicatimonas sp.]